MKKHFLLASFLVGLSLSAFAAEGDYYKVKDLLPMDTLKDIKEESGITLYWGDQATPELVEKARPDTYTKPAISLSPFGGASRHCVQAFKTAVEKMVNDAHERGYDVIANIYFLVDGKPSDDIKGFNCKPGYKVTEVPLISTFAMSATAAKRVSDEEAQAMSGKPRAPVKDAAYMPLEPMLTSPEAASILGKNLSVHWGLSNVPASTERYGPETYSESGDVIKLGKEEACKKAVLTALSVMVEDARDKKYDSIIKIRSYLDETYTPNPNEVECRANGRTAKVSLRATLATKR